MLGITSLVTKHTCTLVVIAGLTLLPALARAATACDPVEEVRYESWEKDPSRKDWGRPGHSQCLQPYSWDELIDGYKDGHLAYKAGGLGKRVEPGGYQTWLCLLENHPCGDPYYCWVYHETNKVFTPWGTSTELKMHLHTNMCPPHSMSPTGSTASAVCLCNAGYMGSDDGTCKQCQEGKYKSMTGNGPCVACPTNSGSPGGSETIGDCLCNAGYTGQNGSTCVSCDAGKYKDSPGSSACTACPDNSVSPAGATGCAFARECEVYGQGLTLATAGLQATFVIQSKDVYNNKRGTGGDLFVVRAFSDGCQNPINNVEGKQTCQPYGPAIATCGGGTDTVCGKNPGPEMNDGGDDDGLANAGVTSVKVGGAYHTAPTPTIAEYQAFCPSCPRIVRGDVVDNGDSTYTASFTGTQKGRYTVVTSLVNSGGLEATYYDADPVTNANDYAFGRGTPRAKRVDMTVDWSSWHPHARPTSITDAEWAVRWVGFVRPSRASQYTFHVHLGPDHAISSKGERVKLWVDNNIIIQQWSSLAASRPSGTMGFAKGNGYYDISMLYKCEADWDSGCGHSLLWENTATGIARDDTAKGVIPSTRLFQRYDVPNTGLTCTGTPCVNKDTSNPSKHTTLQVMPSVTCASQSTVNGDQLSLRTAGVAASFTIQAKDAYENTREDTSASFTVELFGSGGSPIYNGGVSGATASSGNYIASYTAENATVYDLFVKYDSENIKGSPFTTTIKPSNTCGTKSTIQGTGLTAASFPPSKSAFTIQARDQYGNAKTQALVPDQDFVVRVVRTSGAAMQGTRGTPPYYEASAISTSPTVHGTFNNATNDGKYAGYYQVPSIPAPSGYTHYLYASWLAKGGVSATYYTLASAPTEAGTTYSAPVDVLDGGSVATKKRFAGLEATVQKWDSTDTDHGYQKLVTNEPGYGFVIRFNGMYKTKSAQRYFKWDGIAGATNGKMDRVRLWVDNKLIIDQWTSLWWLEPTGGYLFDSASGIYDIHAEFLRTKATDSADTVQVKDGATATAGDAIGTDYLYFTETISGSPYAVTVST